MVDTIIDVMCFCIGLIFLLIISFLFLCMNVFTIPIILLLYIVCRIFHWKTPKPRVYSLMLYPSWSDKAKFSFLDTVVRYNKKSVAKTNAKIRKQFEVTRSWEERFFD